MQTLKLKLNLARRWRKARPGSVLILVVALLVLLALIGTAYLSSTQTERYTSDQNSINTEADLLIQGMINTVNSTVAGGLFGGGAYRPPTQEMPTYTGGVATPAPALSGYFNYDSTVVDPNLKATDPTPPDMFLGDRIPVEPSGVPVWNAISWPLFKDSSGSYTFDSPFGASFQTGSGIQKGHLACQIMSQTVNGTVYPCLQFYSPSANFTPPVGGPTSAQILAADADGDGIADSAFVKLPIGPINGITYYVATRVIDGNSAINASSAWTQGNDTPSAGNSPNNYGFFRTNIGLQELLYSSGASTEMSALNNYRFGGTTLSSTPANVSSAPTNFTWYSYGDEVDNQLVRRPGNPGSDNALGVPFTWLGLTQSAALAYKFSLVNPNSGVSPLEQFFPAELFNNFADNVVFTGECNSMV